jgi:hypothetical protein
VTRPPPRPSPGCSASSNRRSRPAPVGGRGYRMLDVERSRTSRARPMAPSPSPSLDRAGARSSSPDRWSVPCPRTRTRRPRRPRRRGHRSSRPRVATRRRGPSGATRKPPAAATPNRTHPKPRARTGARACRRVRTSGVSGRGARPRRRVAARDGLLAAAAAHREAGRSFAAIDACYLALAVAPADVDLHLMLDAALPRARLARPGRRQAAAAGPARGPRRGRRHAAPAARPARPSELPDEPRSPILVA